jgi:hypothetical protein
LFYLVKVLQFIIGLVYVILSLLFYPINQNGLKQIRRNLQLFRFVQCSVLVLMNLLKKKLCSSIYRSIFSMVKSDLALPLDSSFPCDAERGEGGMRELYMRRKAKTQNKQDIELENRDC